jgi:hypothetical protein
VNVHLLAALKGNEEFHAIRGRQVRSSKSEKAKGLGLKSKSTVRSPQLFCEARDGQWISVTPSTVNGTVLSAQEYRDAFLLPLWEMSGDLQPHHVMVVARSLVFDMLLSARQAEM